MVTAFFCCLMLVFLACALTGNAWQCGNEEGKAQGMAQRLRLLKALEALTVDCEGMQSHRFPVPHRWPVLDEAREVIEEVRRENQ